MSNLSTSLHAFVTELLNGGVKHVVINPGSRNFPLIKTLVAANKFVQLHTCVDERSAGFIALGLAQNTQTTVALCCTSGTAGLNYYPAIAEAFYSKTPLIVLTADRPPESIDNWEGQCIRQENVFSQHTHASFQTPVDATNEAVFLQIGRCAAQQAFLCQGPVHVNMPFREPFYENWHTPRFNVVQSEPLISEHEHIPNAMVGDIQLANKILWVNGASRSIEKAPYPNNLVVFSDVISNQSHGIDGWESLLMTKAIHDEDLLPDVLITTGTYVVSKNLRSFLKRANNLKHWHISDQKNVPSPYNTKPRITNCEIKGAIRAVESNYKNFEYKQRMDGVLNEIKKSLTALNWENDSEFSAIRLLYNSIPNDTILHVSNSMPIRYVGLLPLRTNVFHAANRGTSGIDGCTSTAVGYAKATDKPVYLFSGDLAFLYDINGLWQDVLPSNLKIVVFNNQGGGIFELIDGPKEHPETIAWQTTDHNMDMQHLANHFKIDYLKSTTFQELEACLKHFHSSTKPILLEVQTQRSLNNSFYQDFRFTLDSSIR